MEKGEQKGKKPQTTKTRKESERQEHLQRCIKTFLGV